MDECTQAIPCSEVSLTQTKRVCLQRITKNGKHEALAVNDGSDDICNLLEENGEITETQLFPTSATKGNFQTQSDACTTLQNESAAAKRNSTFLEAMAPSVINKCEQTKELNGGQHIFPKRRSLLSTNRTPLLTNYSSVVASITENLLSTDCDDSTKETSKSKELRSSPTFSDMLLKDPGSVASPKDIESAIFSEHAIFKRHELSIVPRLNETFCYARVLDVDELTVTVFLGRGPNSLPLHKRLPTLFIGKLAASKSSTSTGTAALEAIGSICFWLRNADVRSSLSKNATFLLAHLATTVHKQNIKNSLLISPSASAVIESNDDSTFDDKILKTLKETTVRHIASLSEVAASFAFDVASRSARDFRSSIRMTPKDAEKQNK